MGQEWNWLNIHNDVQMYLYTLISWNFSWDGIQGFAIFSILLVTDNNKLGCILTDRAYMSLLACAIEGDNKSNLYSVKNWKSFYNKNVLYIIILYPEWSSNTLLEYSQSKYYLRRGIIVIVKIPVRYDLGRI